MVAVNKKQKTFYTASGVEQLEPGRMLLFCYRSMYT